MHHPRINLLRLEEELSAVHLRLSRVTIENLPWQKFVQRYDRPDTLLYLDPPYYKAPYYNYNFELADFEEMASILSTVKSRFILSINDHPDIRDQFKAFKIKPVTLKYTVAKGQQTKGSELLITNY